MPSNKLLPIIAGLVLVMLVFVGIKSIDSGGDDTVLDQVPVAGMPDADSPADTIRTLTAQVASIKSESEKLQMQNQELLRQRQEIESKVRAQLLTEMRSMKDKEDTTAVSKLTEKLDFFKNQLDELTHAQNGASQQSPGSDIPVGFGIGSGDGINLPKSTETTWIEPLGTSKDRQGNWVYPALSKSGDEQNPTDDSGGLLGKSSATEAYLKAKLDEAEPDEPVYTVPRNATLIGSTGMTALIGRIPFKGVVEDPFPFKVIVGRDNLAANGIEVPGLDGMVFSGKATGDWTLSCVRGEIISVTYVYADGTIRELSADTTKNLLASQQGQQQGSQQRKMGWISDRRGIPCVTGTRISNAPDYLAGRILASAAEAAAGAFSQAQTTNAVSLGQGVATSVITGDAGKFAAGQAMAGGANEVSQYLRERAAQSFDAVYVDTGAELAVHVDIELPIDYEPDGRKTHYASTQTTDDEVLD